ncbi:MAG: tetratricopeptide repeat protein [Chloroflexi bacterium]|nr:tetratricopeptide repeat protein [Chloroflexota bacterium]
MNETVRIDSQFTLAYNDRGLAHAGLDRFQLAVQDFAQTIIVDPEFVLAYSNRGCHGTNEQDIELEVLQHFLQVGVGLLSPSYLLHIIFPLRIDKIIVLV